MNKTTMNEGSTPKETYCMGFRFTETDERRMACAKIAARRYMKNYGKGRQPFMLNRDNYYCNTGDGEEQQE